MLPELPVPFLRRIRDQVGPEYDGFLTALKEPSVISLRYNPSKPGAIFPEGNPIPWCNEGVYLSERPKFFRDPFIYTGAYYVQEASSMLIAQCLDFSQDQVVLDLCAAPGGKSTLIASKLSPDSFLVSNEIVGSRSRALVDNLSRWGKPNTMVTVNHPRDFSHLRHTFDTIVVDAPCSGEGMFRKDPSVIETWTPGVVRHCALRQKEILGQVTNALKPGGRLIYSTCTYNSTENEAIINWVLNHEPGVFRIVPLEFPEEWGLTPGKTQGYPSEMAYTYHCYPHKVKGEGFYFACLEKVRPGRDFGLSPSRKRKQRRHSRNYRQNSDRPEPRKKVELGREERKIASTYLNRPEELDLLVRKEGFDAIEPKFTKLVEKLGEHLRVAKAGVRIGTVMNKKLIPDHDLALSEQTSGRVPKIEVDTQTALRYMKRESLTLDVGKVREWAVLTFRNRHLGWVKVLDNRVNNHLPKELKIRAEI